MFLWKQDSGDLKRALKDLKSPFYQMDHIWGAPSGVKKSKIFIFWEKKAVTFGPQFPKTLYSQTRVKFRSGEGQVRIRKVEVRLGPAQVTQKSKILTSALQ